MEAWLSQYDATTRETAARVTEVSRQANNKRLEAEALKEQYSKVGGVRGRWRLRLRLRLLAPASSLNHPLKPFSTVCNPPTTLFDTHPHPLNHPKACKRHGRLAAAAEAHASNIRARDQLIRDTAARLGLPLHGATPSLAAASSLSSGGGSGLTGQDQLPQSVVEAFAAEMGARVAELQRQLAEAKAANGCVGGGGELGWGVGGVRRGSIGGVGRVVGD